MFYGRKVLFRKEIEDFRGDSKVLRGKYEPWRKETEAPKTFPRTSLKNEWGELAEQLPMRGWTH